MATSYSFYHQQPNLVRSPYCIGLLAEKARYVLGVRPSNDVPYHGLQQESTPGKMTEVHRIASLREPISCCLLPKDWLGIKEVPAGLTCYHSMSIHSSLIVLQQLLGRIHYNCRSS